MGRADCLRFEAKARQLKRETEMLRRAVERAGLELKRNETIRRREGGSFAALRERLKRRAGTAGQGAAASRALEELRGTGAALRRAAALSAEADCRLRGSLALRGRLASSLGRRMKRAERLSDLIGQIKTRLGAAARDLEHEAVLECFAAHRMAEEKERQGVDRAAGAAGDDTRREPGCWSGASQSGEGPWPEGGRRGGGPVPGWEPQPHDDLRRRHCAAEDPAFERFSRQIERIKAWRDSGGQKLELRYVLGNGLTVRVSVSQAGGGALALELGAAAGRARSLLRAQRRRIAAALAEAGLDVLTIRVAGEAAEYGAAAG